MPIGEAAIKLLPAGRELEVDDMIEDQRFSFCWLSSGLGFLKTPV